MSLEQRLIVFSAQEEFIFEIAPSKIYKAVMVEEINGEHSLTIITSYVLEKKNRILTVDKTGKWREFVVTGCTQTRGGSEPFKQYRCVWSLQDDARLFGVDEYIDEEDNIVASSALSMILSNTSRWNVGTVDVTTIAGADLTQTDGWSALSKLVENWGGEIEATISVTYDGTITRYVDLLQHVGTTTANRRFDYTKDMTQISRKVDESNIGCRVRPYGKSEDTIDGLKVKLTIEEVNDGKDYIQNDEVAQYMRFPDGQGGYEYPTVNIENSGIDDPEELMQWAESVLLDYTTPTITYEANVLQYEEAGTSQAGLNYGDSVQCVDSEFFDGAPLRLESRVTRKETDLLDKRRTVIRIGNAKSVTSSISGSVSKLKSTISELRNAYTTTAQYLNDIVSYLNSEINATGGYAYLTDGYGIVTYDIAVDDPLIGYNSASNTWASKVVQIKGGSIRIADSKNASFAGINDWQWKTVFVSGHIASELVTAVSVTAGYIGSPNGGNYWNIDTGEIRIVPTALIGNTSETLQDLIDGVAATITQVDVQYAQNQSNTSAPTYGWSTTAPTWQSGYYIWQRTAVTDGNGTTYSQPTCISGREGQDGTSVSILGSYNTLAELQAAHPTGSTGDGYIISGDLYVWNGSIWEDVGTIQGPAGTNGANGYVHVAWANSADGSVDFSTSVASGKSYVGMYTDNSSTSSQTYTDYSWSLIKGADGSDGTGITSIVEEYYLSTSNSTQTGGSWSTTQPTWESGKYIWTRSAITWDTTPATVTYTTPILAQALTQANSLAKSASDNASNAITAVNNLSTQQAIFNLLTNNGTLPGLYMANNQLYINANYIASGYIGDTNGKSYWDISDGTIVIVNATKNFNNRNEQFKFGTITFTDSSGWLNTRTGQQTATGIMVGDTTDSTVAGRSRIYMIPNLPATSSNSSASTETVIISRDALKIMSGYSGSTTRGCISLNSGYVEINQVLGSTVKPGIILESTGLHLYATRSNYTLNNGNTTTSITSSLYVSSNSSTFNTGLTIAGTYGLSVQNGPVTIGKSGAYKNLTVYGKITSYNGLSVSGTKSRFVDTNDYGERLLYCYETPSPMFGDIGSGIIGEDGVCVVSIDDVFGECARTDMAYQVFLQKCGPGDLWVSEKAPTHFVVEGTPGLAFDWEAKAHQTGFELERLEDMERRDDSDDMGIEDLSPLDAYAEEETGEQFDPYEDELGYIEEIESLYEEAA